MAAQQSLALCEKVIILPGLVNEVWDFLALRIAACTYSAEPTDWQRVKQGAEHTTSTAQSCTQVCHMLLQVQQTEALGIDPIVDYIFPIWPSLNCFNPARTDNSSITPSAGFESYYAAVQAKANQFITTGLFFTAQ